MFPYLFIFLLATILYYRNIKEANFLVYFFFIVFIGLAGFRDMIGGYDVYIYSAVFEGFKGKLLFLYKGFEKGFLAYYFLLQEFSQKREFLLFVTAVTMGILHFYVIKKHSSNISFSLYVYFCKFFLFSFVYLRQGIAMGVIWLSISFLIQRKYLYTLLIIAFAFTLHRSSIVFLPFVFIAHKRLSNYQILLITMCIIFISLTPLASDILSNFAENIGSNKLAKYAQKEGSINFFYIIEGVLGIYLSTQFRKYFYKSLNTTIILNGLFIYSVAILGGVKNATFIRFSWYYFIFVVLALPYIHNYIQSKNVRSLYKNLVYVYYALVFFRLLIVYDGGDFMPYKSIFQDFDRHGKWEWMEYRDKY